MLEIIHRGAHSTERPPLLFLHGSYCGAWIWDEHFLPYFAERGFAAYAFSLRGHGGSPGHENLLNASLDDYVEDLGAAIRDVASLSGDSRPPILICHSMGGMIAQRYLESGALSGVVFLAPASPQGLIQSATWMMLRRPAFLWQLNLFQTMGPVIGEAHFLDGLMRELFSTRLSREEIARYLPRVQRESARVAADLSFPLLPKIPKERFPRALVIAGDQDVFYPPEEFERTARLYFADFGVIPGANHMLMLDECRQEVAAKILGWINSC